MLLFAPQTCASIIFICFIFLFFSNLSILTENVDKGFVQSDESDVQSPLVSPIPLPSSTGKRKRSDGISNFSKESSSSKLDADISEYLTKKKRGKRRNNG